MNCKCMLVFVYSNLQMWYITVHRNSRNFGPRKMTLLKILVISMFHIKIMWKMVCIAAQTSFSSQHRYLLVTNNCCSYLSNLKWNTLSWVLKLADSFQNSTLRVALNFMVYLTQFLYGTKFCINEIMVLHCRPLVFFVSQLSDTQSKWFMDLCCQDV